MRLALLLLLAGCADPQPDPRVIDLDGPHGRAEAPGPWPVTVVAAEVAPEIWWAADDGAYERLDLNRVSSDHAYAGFLPDQQPGTTLRYYARAGGDLEPPGAPEVARTAEVVVEAPAADAGRPPRGCALSFRRPVDGQRVGLLDDGAPQAGIQLTVVLAADLPDGATARLRVDDTNGYAGVAGAGVVAFEGVDLSPGERVLRVDALVPGGAPCEASATVRVEARP